MRIERSTHNHGNLYPEVHNYLKQLPEHVLHYSEFRQRPPFSIYSLSTKRVIDAFHKLLHELEHLNSATFNADGLLDYDIDKISACQIELLESMQSHIDDCYLILKVTMHPYVSLNKQYIYTDTWLEKAKHPTFNSFRQSINDYREYVAKIVNKAKHNHGRLRTIVMHSITPEVRAFSPDTGLNYLFNNLRVHGYYLEGVHDNGAVGPDPDIHEGGNTAISFNYDLRKHFANFYRIGKLLNKYLKNAYRKSNLTFPHSSNVKANHHHEILEYVAESISSMPFVMMENERNRKTPVITLLKRNEDRILCVELPGNKGLILDPKAKIRMSTKFQIDPSGKPMKVPYFNGY